MLFKLPYSLLPSNKIQRRELLDSYFPFDLIPFEESLLNEWKVISFIPDDIAYYPDPLLQSSLQKWYEPVVTEKIGSYWRIYKNTMLSFNDSWSLLYWSHVSKWLRSMSGSWDNVALIHVDDHRDLASPLIIKSEGKNQCIFSGQDVDFDRPETIERALTLKSIDIRSFIVPLAQSTRLLKILHLRYEQPVAHSCFLALTEFPDSLLAVGKHRPSLTPVSQETFCSYMISSNPKIIVDEAQANSLILLHIDCDGFYNRYDGCSSGRDPRSNLDMAEIKQRITQLFYHFRELTKPVFINIALSPGFYPSEFWRETCYQLYSTGEKMGIIREDDFSRYLRQNCSEYILEGSYEKLFN